MIVQPPNHLRSTYKDAKKKIDVVALWGNIEDEYTSRYLEIKRERE
jgi:hypothetical protein